MALLVLPDEFSHPVLLNEFHLLDLLPLDLFLGHQVDLAVHLREEMFKILVLFMQFFELFTLLLQKFDDLLLVQ